jgi:hypothetical protein
MSFLATNPVPTVTEDPAESAVKNDGWFPDIAPAELRQCTRLDGTVTPSRLRHAVINAITSVNRELAAFKASQIAAGHTSLGDVPAEQVDEKSVKVALYQRAVYDTVRADMAERLRDIDTTGAGDKEADKMVMPIDDLRRSVRWAISDLTGIRRTTVELI